MPIVKIEKLIFGGQGLGRINGQVVLVWGALPGEEVEIEMIQKSKTLIEAVATKIITPSPTRIAPRDEAFVCIAPWQIMNFAEENKWKQIISAETYTKIGGFEWPEEIEIVSDEREYGYRNKVEYNFTEENGQIKFAVTQRGGKRRIAIAQNSLVEEFINQQARLILAWINEIKIPLRSLKTLIARGNRAGEVIIGLFIKDELVLEKYPALTNGLVGLQIYYSTHKSPASVPTKKLMSFGQEYLEENLLTTKLRYGLFSFFQINPPVFETCLTDMAQYLNPERNLVDFYSGVGAISLPLNKYYGRADLVEESEEAIFFAKENIALNNLTNKCSAVASRAEKMLDFIVADKIVILDPPRAGLHNKVIEKIKAVRPERIIYLSCNLSTQARDYSMLADIYQIKKIKLYNFFPRTPHVEGMMAWERK